MPILQGVWPRKSICNTQRKNTRNSITTISAGTKKIVGKIIQGLSYKNSTPKVVIQLGSAASSGNITIIIIINKGTKRFVPRGILSGGCMDD